MWTLFTRNLEVFRESMGGLAGDSFWRDQGGDQEHPLKEKTLRFRPDSKIMSAFQIEGLILSIAEVDSNLLGPILMVLILQRILDQKKKKKEQNCKQKTALL